MSVSSVSSLHRKSACAEVMGSPARKTIGKGESAELYKEAALSFCWKW